MGFATALSGLKAASVNLQVTGNNIANSQTTGFKESRTEFADVYASSLGGVASTQPGSGVKVTNVAQQFAQGNIEGTQNSLDMAISGNGFFVLADHVNLPDPNNPNAAVDPSVPDSYTRNGAFQLNSAGNVVNNQGKYLLAFAANGTTAAQGFSVGVFRPLTIDTSQGLPVTTTNISMRLNINGAASLPTSAVFSPTDPHSYNNTTSVTTYDTQGNAHIASTYYVKTPVANAWDMYLFLDGFGITTGGPAVPPTAAPPSTVVGTVVNQPGLPVPVTFTASGLLADVGLLAAKTLTTTGVAAAATAVTNANTGTVAATGASAWAYSAAAASDAATASTNAAAAVALGAGAAQDAACITALTSANAALTSATALNTANTAHPISPAVTLLAVAVQTAATTAQLSATAADALGPGAAQNAAAVTAAADAVATQTAITAYNAAVNAATATTSAAQSAQASLAAAQSASSSAAAMLAAASVVNSTPANLPFFNAPALAAANKTAAQTAATDAKNYEAAAAAVITAIGLPAQAAAAANAATLANTAKLSAIAAQTAMVNYNAAVTSAAVGATTATKVDFGSINLGLINPNASVNPMAFAVDFFGSTQFATPFSVNALQQDGLPAGNLTGIDVDNHGVVFARYSNGGSKALGQVALSRFPSNQSLAKLGDTIWAQTSSSGQPIFGAAGDNNFGTIQSSALEGSNTDLSAQLVKLIIAQQAYQANSQTITTEKTLIQTILNA